MLVAQVSDFHVVLPDTVKGQVMRTPSYLSAAITHLASTDADVVLATGDLVDEGSAEEYQLLAELLEECQRPVYLIPGNHDNREELRRVFRERGHSYLPAQGWLQYCISLEGLRIVALDTLVPGEPGGLLCKSRLQWLDERLAEDQTPTLVMQHHPPFKTGLSRMDAMGLCGAEEEEAIIAKHPHVQAVVAGHLHRTMSRRFGGTIASTAPSTAHAVELDLRSAGRLAVLREPPACALHYFSEGKLVTHTSFIGDYGPAHVIS